MVKIPRTFDLGDDDLDLETLKRRIEEMYIQIAESLNRKPDVYFREVDGQSTDVILSNGDININISSSPKKVEILTAHTSPTAVEWKEI